MPFYITIDWVVFDNYVFTHIISPKLNNERIFEQIRIAMNMNTIAVLALGFLVDFSMLSNKWVFGYIIIILVMVFISFYFSFIAWIP